MIIPDQQPVWDAKHAAGEHAQYRGEPGVFGLQMETGFLPCSRVLDLGCGVGGDAYYLAEQGHEVIAVDLSGTVLRQNQKMLENPELHWAQVDMSKGLPFKSGAFDAVFAHLSVHYFDDETTRRTFGEVARVLALGGIFAFACKTVDDPGYGRGKEVESDVYVDPGGHVRHFFSRTYTYSLIKNLFSITHLDEVQQNYGNTSASFIRCITRKVAELGGGETV